MGGTKRVQGVKKYPGVSSRNNSISIMFVWPKGGRSQKEISLKGLKANDKNLKYAVGLVDTVKREIDLGVFTWAKHFPGHPLAQTELKAKAGYTIADLLDDYLRDYAQSRREGITLDNYTYRSDVQLKPKMGKIPVNHFTAAHVVKWAIERGNAGVSRTTLKSYIAPLRSAFNWAREQQITELDPFLKFKWPEETKAVQKKAIERRKQKKMDVFSIQEINTLVSSCKRPQEANIIQFGFWTGLRPEELFALHWEDIDLVNGTALINKAKVYRRGFKVIGYEIDEREEIKGVKTGELGERTVLLLPAALDAIQKQKQWTMMMKKFVFHNPFWNRAWTNTNQFANRFKECCLAADVRYRRPYMMRHTYASMMLKAREDESWVANQLGHVDTTMIRTTYREFIPDFDEGAGYKPRNDWAKHGIEIG